MNAGRESRVDCLSDREVEVLRLISEGLSLEEVAQRLHRSVDTVKSHRRRIGRKLGVRNRVELIKIAIESGLVSVRVKAEAGGRIGLISALEHAGVAACIVEDGVVVAANREFEGLSPEGPATLDRVFADAGARWLAEVTAAVGETGAGYAAVRLAGREEVVGVRACRSTGGGVALVIERARRNEASRGSPRDDESTARQALLSRLITDGTLYAPEGGVYAVLLWRLTKLFEASHAVLLEPDDGGLRAVTVWSRQRGLESTPPRFPFPAELLAGGQALHVPDGLAEMYPDLANGLADSARAMVALPIQGAGGSAIGAVVLLSDRPWPDAQEALAVLRPVAGRLGGELARTRAERGLAELERRMLRLSEVVPGGVFRADDAGELLWCNPGLAGVLGLPAEQCLGRGWLRAVHMDDRAELERLVARTETARVEEACVRLAGSQPGAGRALVRLTADFGPRGERAGLIGSIVPDRGPEAVPAQAGPTAEPFLTLVVDGIGRAEGDSPSLPELVAPEEAEFTRRLLAQALAGRTVAGAVIRLRETPSGPMWARIALAPGTRGASGGVETVRVQLWDETQAWLTQAMASLSHLGWSNAQEEHRRGHLPVFGAVETARVGVLCTDDRGVFLGANAAARRWLGLPAERLGAASVCDIRTAPGYRSGAELFAEHAAMRGGSGTIHVLDSGEVRRLAFRGHPTPCGLHVAVLEPS
jgi:DNA-binding CsgD family transcriptional regulator